MAFEVKVPAVGESVQEGEIYKWHKASGDWVDVDDVLVELETDKATVDIVAEASGVIELVGNEGDTVQVGQLLAKIDTDAVKPAGAAPEAAARSAAPVNDGAAPEATRSAAPANVTPIAKPASNLKAGVMSPAAQRVVAEAGLSAATIHGTGKDGRITKEDAERAASSPQVITSSQVVTQVSSAPGERPERREKMSRLRRRIAERLVSAQQTAAMLTTFNEIDMSGVMDLRKQYKDKFKEDHGVGLGFMSFFLKASVEALKAHPAINGWIEGEEIVYHDYYDIGVAVSTEKGLVVPVVRDCDKLNFAQIESTILDFALRGRDGKLGVDEMNGGTFTVSNGGTFGSLLSTPILNPPQSAIMGMHKIEKRPVVVGDKIEIRPMMYVAVSYDHRIVDGKEAVGFLVKIKECIEDPTRLLLGV